jgi:hypothetical protein
MLANCGASSRSNSAAFRLRDSRSSVLISGISSFRLRAMLLQLHILAGLNAEQHLASKLLQGSAQLAAQLRAELRQLSFQPRA